MATPKKQRKIGEFFSGSSKKQQESDSSGDESHSSPENKPEKVKGSRFTPPDASSLPPLVDVKDMFADIVHNIPQIKQVAEHVKGRKLRVATMCSGTESPLLAMDLMFKAVEKEYGIKMEFEHVFSCEIEPFKQAYIERNFSPPLLFRDVCELGEDEAHTAYGSLETVPGDVDILIAGTSCVDYSNLNNEKQDIDANGESGRTFRGMMNWVTKHRPPLVILENVLGAPWPRVAKYFEAKRYSASFLTCDTKNYYIPHTRQRKYLLAVDQAKSSIPAKWENWVGRTLKRDASASLDAFLLPSDDPRIHHSRKKLANEAQNAIDKRTQRVDWGRCESRHQRARAEEELGQKRPLTGWEEAGKPKLPDYAWGDWGDAQVERVWDLLDISLLRSAKKGIDPSYKTEVWNLSQNVDRTTASGKPGICPCLTPTMIPYITNRGGPMVGLEALSMQGLPIDQLLLTRETEDQLSDLAGNAMSTTVVGTCIIAALVTGQNLLKSGDDTDAYNGEDSMKVDSGETSTSSIPPEDRITGEEYLTSRKLDLSAGENTPMLADILEDATKSSRLCICEGRMDITSAPLIKCADCDNTSCTKCGGRPEHTPVPIDPASNPRLYPSSFAQELKAALPMCLSLSGVTAQVLEQAKESAGVSISAKRWDSWSLAVLDASKHELNFVETKRQEIWTVVYRSQTAQLELILHPQEPEWRLYAKPRSDEPANSDVRKLLHHSVARIKDLKNLMEGTWEFALPYERSFEVEIEGSEDMVPSWGNRLGLTGEEHRNAVVHSQLKISVPDDVVPCLDRDVSGTYTLLPKCGTANGALHKRIDNSGKPPVYFFMDPHRTNIEEDSFVFSISKRRCEYGETRPIIAKLSPSWRQSDKSGVQKVKCRALCHWVSSKVTLKPSLEANATFAVPTSDLTVPVGTDSCLSANAILVCKAPINSDSDGLQWRNDTWEEVDKVHERGTFKALAWMLEPTRQTVNEQFMSWQTVPDQDIPHRCERCAPSPPEVKWVQGKSKKSMIPVENVIQAGQYERNLKSRPSPFVTQMRIDSNIGTVRVGINFSSLIHRAVSCLPTEHRTEKVAVSWRVNTNFTPSTNTRFPKYRLLSNKSDKEHAQPPNFKLKLRKEQLRSLGWMLEREALNVEPFIEEEIAEAIFEPLGWRAEGRAERPVYIRGGVLADDVGYGKTVITLAMIDCASAEVEAEFDEREQDAIPGRILSKATLIIVPPHLPGQWRSEVDKFTKKGTFEVIVIQNVADLNKITIEKVQNADIIILSSSVFASEIYLENLQAFSGSRSLPSSEGRHFRETLKASAPALRANVELLKSKKGGSEAVMKAIRGARKKAEDEDAEALALLQSKRLKGKAYRDKADLEEAQREQADEPKSLRAKPTPSGLVPVVELSPRSSASRGSSEEAEGSRPKRKNARKVIVISDDDDEEPPKKAKGTKSVKSKAGKKGKGKGKGKKAASSDEDFEASDASEPEDDDSDVVSSEDEEKSKSKRSVKAKPKPARRTKKAVQSSDADESSEAEQSTRVSKGKKAAKTKRSSKSSAAETTSDDEATSTSMDVDSPKKATKSKKRKADDDLERPAKKKKHREESDPWKLESAPVKKNWKAMQCPPFELFHFARTVVDEYTYLKAKSGKIHALVTGLSADRRWVLSGTPPVHSFDAVQGIAAFLNLHLGIDDDGSSLLLKRGRGVSSQSKEQSSAEKFHSFREVRSIDWHAHRHSVGQLFLDRFVRQNKAEIDEIPYTIKTEEVILPAAERAIYLELDHHLRAMDMTMTKRNKKATSDREKRLQLSLGESKSPEEALLKRCSHFDLDLKETENAMKACDYIVDQRQKQLQKCKEDLLKALKDGVKREADIRSKIKQTIDESFFSQWVRNYRRDGVGDTEATEMVNQLLDEAKATPSKAGKANAQLTEKEKALIWGHREATHVIRALVKELVGRVRSLRFFTVVRDVQKERKEESPLTFGCPTCNRNGLTVDDVAVLSTCGHVGCVECVTQHAEKEECVYAGSGQCTAAARTLNIVKASTLGVDDVERDGKGKHYGTKLENVITLIKKRIPKDERILIFVQFDDLLKKVSSALTENKIDHLMINKGTSVVKNKALEEFQEENSKRRVLLLNAMDESASGANLTMANHAIFLSPLLTQTKAEYDQNETQAIGRVVRYGQTKHVHIWRFVSRDTIDEEIYKQRKEEVAEAAQEDEADEMVGIE